MRLSVRALRPARPELFVNYISCAFIAPQPPTTEKPPPPPQTASRARGAPASRRPGCDGSAGPQVSGSPTRDFGVQEGRLEPAGEVRGRPAGQVRPGVWVGPAAAQRGLCQAVIKDLAPLPLILSPLTRGLGPRAWGKDIRRSERVLQPCARRYGTQEWGTPRVGEAARGLSLPQPRDGGGSRW